MYVDMKKVGFRIVVIAFKLPEAALYSQAYTGACEADRESVQHVEMFQQTCPKFTPPQQIWVQITSLLNFS